MATGLEILGLRWPFGEYGRTGLAGLAAADDMLRKHRLVPLAANGNAVQAPSLQNRLGKRFGRIARAIDEAIAYADEGKNRQLQIEQHISQRVARFEQTGGLHDDQRRLAAQV